MKRFFARILPLFAVAACTSAGERKIITAPNIDAKNSSDLQVERAGNSKRAPDVGCDIFADEFANEKIANVSSSLRQLFLRVAKCQLQLDGKRLLINVSGNDAVALVNASRHECPSPALHEVGIECVRLDRSYSSIDVIFSGAAADEICPSREAILNEFTMLQLVPRQTEHALARSHPPSFTTYYSDSMRIDLTPGGNSINQCISRVLILLR